MTYAASQGVKRVTETDRLRDSIDQVAAIVYAGADPDDVVPQPCRADGFGTSVYKRTITELRVRAFTMSASVSNLMSDQLLSCREARQCSRDACAHMYDAAAMYPSNPSPHVYSSLLLTELHGHTVVGVPRG
jgi:hypothetical protein